MDYSDIVESLRGKACPKCGEVDTLRLEMSKGLTYCSSCGFVVNESVITTGTANLTWDQNTLRCHGTVVKEGQTGNEVALQQMVFASGMAGRGGMYRSWLSLPASQKNQVNADVLKGPLERLASKLRLNHQVKHEALCLFEQLAPKDEALSVSEADKTVLVGACVYAACRIHHFALFLKEIAEAINCTDRELYQATKVLQQEFGLQLPAFDLNELLAKCLVLLRDMRVVRREDYKTILSKGESLINFCHTKYIITGRKPIPIVSAVIFLVLKDLDFRAKLLGERTRLREVEVKDITDVLEQEYQNAISRHTVGERVKDIRDRFNDLRKAMLSRDAESLPFLPDPEAFGKKPEDSWEDREDIPDAFVMQWIRQLQEGLLTDPQDDEIRILLNTATAAGRKRKSSASLADERHWANTAKQVDKRVNQWKSCFLAAMTTASPTEAAEETNGNVRGDESPEGSPSPSKRKGKGRKRAKTKGKKKDKTSTALAIRKSPRKGSSASTVVLAEEGNQRASALSKIGVFVKRLFPVTVFYSRDDDDSQSRQFDFEQKLKPGDDKLRLQDVKVAENILNATSLDEVQDVLRGKMHGIRRHACSDDIDDAEVDKYLKPEKLRIFTEEVQKLKEQHTVI